MVPGRDTYLLVRGDFRTKGEKVSAATPAFPTSPGGQRSWRHSDGLRRSECRGPARRGPLGRRRDSGQPRGSDRHWGSGRRWLSGSRGVSLLVLVEVLWQQLPELLGAGVVDFTQPPCMGSDGGLEHVA